jgi:zinc D-Ala-D-Ala carboxypeptidase
MISTNLSLKEATKSNTARRLGIDNIPDDYAIGNMELIAKKVFQPLREWVGGPIRVNSFYRCEELNRAIGGSSKSQHCEGRAIDLDDIYKHATNAEMFKYIKENLNFDQLIWEFGDEENPDWIHVSYVSEDQNRNRCLKAYKLNGKTKYELI